jgi:hypothetical protein
MMRHRNAHRFHKRDRNHAEIAAALRQVGCRVLDLSHVGDGAPDAIVAFRGQIVLLEFKTARGKLTPAEANFHREWEGQPVHVVRSIEEAVALVGALE